MYKAKEPVRVRWLQSKSHCLLVYVGKTIDNPRREQSKNVVIKETSSCGEVDKSCGLWEKLKEFTTHQ